MQRTANRQDLELVSIVVTTKNEEANIALCLESLKRQTYPRIEIVVVDNKSVDATKRIAHNFTELVFECGPERSAQRNFGLLHVAKGQILGYVDADMILGPLVVEQAVQCLAKSVVGVYIPETVVGTSFLAKVRRFEREFYDSTSIDAVRFFRAEAFRRVGGFDAELFKHGSGEDWDLDNSLELIGNFASVSRSQFWISSSEWTLLEPTSKFGIRKIDAACIYHNESEIELVSYLRKKSYYSIGFSGYQSKWGLRHPRVKDQFSLRYRYLGVFIENGKWRRVLQHPVLSVSTLGLRFLVGCTYLWSKVGS